MLAGKECEPDLGPLHSVIVGSLSFPFFFVVFAIYRVKAGALLATTSKVPIRAANLFIEFAFGASIHIISLFYSAPRLCPYFITVFFPFFSRWLCPIPEPNNVGATRRLCPMQLTMESTAEVATSYHFSVPLTRLINGIGHITSLQQIAVSQTGRKRESHGQHRAHQWHRLAGL